MSTKAATAESKRYANAARPDVPDTTPGGSSPLPGCQSEAVRCYHCGLPCRDARFARGDKDFCCHGCLTVFELLSENGLDAFYAFGQRTGIRGGGPSLADRFRFLDEPAVRERLVDFSDARLTRVTFHVPAIHCVACVWLLENLFALKPGLGPSRVNFPRKEVALSFDPAQVKLSDVAALLTALGYEPELKLSDLRDQPERGCSFRLWLQLGIAGFAFGNTMLFSIATYFGLDSATGPGFQRLVGVISLALAIPVVAYSALDYWRSAWTSLRQRLLNIDVPIAAGILALFAQSTVEVVNGRGEGYFDSLTGLIFFLLCGRLFQQKTFERLAFDRDYRSFFPLSVTRRAKGGEETVSLSELAVGDRLVIRNNELIPADSRLRGGPALIDYSFVTGESEPVVKAPGEYLYAGGRQIGGRIELETVKAVSHGYLASLWNQGAFRKETEGLSTLTNRYSQRFTKLVIGIAAGAALFWAAFNPALSWKAFTSVLIVACPCALALAAPFALGTGQRVLARRGVFLRNPSVLETLAAADAVVFDKTGTLTVGSGAMRFHGPPLEEREAEWVRALAVHSTHPHALRLAREMSATGLTAESFHETAGCGIEGQVAGHTIRLGSAEWLRAGGVESKEGVRARASGVHVAIDGRYRGWFELSSALRPEADQLLASLSPSYDLALLSGDNARESARFGRLFGKREKLRFHQSPLDKLQFIRQLQEQGKRVIMVGDGLNDAGALRQSDAGVAVVEKIGAFSPASDVIMAGGMVSRLDRVARFAKGTVRIVRLSFLISALYNAAGIAIAARGLLSPVVCAVLMPLSSVTVVAFACGATTWLGRRMLEPKARASRDNTPAAKALEVPKLAEAGV